MESCLFRVHGISDLKGYPIEDESAEADKGYDHEAAIHIRCPASFPGWRVASAEVSGGEEAPAGAGGRTQ